MSTLAAEAARVASKGRRRRSDGWSVAGWIYSALLTVFAMLPMAWMLSTALKSQFAALQYPPYWIPSQFSLLSSCSCSPANPEPEP